MAKLIQAEVMEEIEHGGRIIRLKLTGALLRNY